MRNTNLLAGLMLMTVAMSAAEADIVVQLSNKVGVGTLELVSAKRVATALMAKAGLKVRFVDCGVCEDSSDPRVFLMSIDDKVPERLHHVLGYALPYTERANRASLNYPMIGKASPGNTEHLLGSVMAHELAHLLFRSAAHSGGLMKQGFTAQDIRAMCENRLVFSPEQAAALRAGLQSRLTETMVAVNGLVRP